GTTSQPLGFPAPLARRLVFPCACKADFTSALTSKRRANGTGRAHRLSVRSTPEIHYGSNGFRTLTCFEVPLQLNCIPSAPRRQIRLLTCSPIFRHKLCRSKGVALGRARMLFVATTRSGDRVRRRRVPAAFPLRVFRVRESSEPAILRVTSRYSARISSTEVSLHGVLRHSA